MLVFPCIILLYMPYIFCKIEMVIELSRHGARETIYDVISTKLLDSKGELTPVGMYQHYKLGESLRKLYIEKENLLSKTYNPKEIYVRSTNYNRTIMSAISQIQGLYHSVNMEKIEMDINLIKTPFEYKDNNLEFVKNEFSDKDFILPGGFSNCPVHVWGLEEDFLLRPFDVSICPLNNKLQNEQYNGKIYKEWEELFKNNMFKELENIFKIDSKNMNLWTVFDIFDVIENMKYLGKSLNVTLSDNLIRNMTFIHNSLIFYLYYGSEAQKRVSSTPLFTEILDFFDRKITKTEEKKMIIYSGHDRTVSIILSALNYSNYECVYQNYLQNKELKSDTCLGFPVFASNLLFELHYENNGYFVKIRYNGKYLKLWNKEACPYSEFTANIRRYILKYDFFTVCNNDDIDIDVEPESEKYKKSLKAEGINIFAAFLKLVLGSLIGFGIIGTIFYYFYIYKNENMIEREGYAPY